jgi:YesN/AraC family two-component response regulator
MTVLPNFIQENPFSIRRVVTSKSDCLDLEDQYQIVYLVRGAILHWEGGQRKTVRERHLLLIPPSGGTELRVAALSKFYQLCFAHTSLEHLRFFDSQRIRTFCLPDELASRVQNILSQMQEEYTGKKYGYERMFGLKLEELGLLLERTLPRIWKQQHSGSSATIEEVVAYIQTHYTEQFSLSSLARLCDLTPSYFSRVFREKMGTPPFEYINRVRVQKACTLLKRSDMPVIEIAFAVGYNNLSFFNRYFHKLNGISPREYRKFIRT